MLVLLIVIVFQGFATHTVGLTAEPHRSGVHAPLAHSRPILVARGGTRLVSAESPPGRRIALTFDDGPSAKWTPKIAAALRAAGARATFFVIGSQAARYPNIVRQLVHDGDEIGNHTFTHVLLPTVPDWERHLQVDLTESVIEGITGHYTRLIRPPYSATPDAVTPTDERVLAELAGRRYYIVLADYDSRDWERPGVADIVRAATPPGRTGGIVLMHDGGGQRQETLAAVKRLIPLLRSRGFQFVTVSQLAGLPPAVAMPNADGWVRSRGTVFVYSVRFAYALTTVSAIVLYAIAILVIVRALLLFAFATYQVRRKSRQPQIESSWPLPPVAVIVPAYNEQVNIERTVRSLAASDYPEFEIVVIDDGSTDRTAEIVAALDLPRVRLVRQDNLGKAAALQTGVDVTDAEILAMVDADTQFEPETLRLLVHPFQDARIAAVSGNTKVGNRSGIIGRWQHLEYVIAFNLDRRMYDVLRAMPTIPGAIGAFRRDALDAVGGVPGETIAEDTDLTLAIGRTGRRVAYVEEARAWTEAPSDLRGLWRQRYRWSFGIMQAIFKHRRGFFSLRRGQRRIGWFTLPYILAFYLVLPLVAPAIDLFAIYGILFTGAVRTLAVWGAFNLLQVATAAYGLKMDREPMRTLWAVPLQQFVYRQLMYLVIIESLVSALQGARSGWRHVARTGDAVVGAQ